MTSASPFEYSWYDYLHLQTSNFLSFFPDLENSFKMGKNRNSNAELVVEPIRIKIPILEKLDYYFKAPDLGVA